MATPPKTPDAAYLGDGVYVDIDPRGGCVLTTENGIEATNTIVMEDEVIVAFERWINRMREKANEPTPIDLEQRAIDDAKAKAECDKRACCAHVGDRLPTSAPDICPTSCPCHV